MKKQLSEFKKNFFIVLSGATLSQLIPILITPLLTRIYGPDDLGILALYVSITTIPSILSSFRYDQAIMLAENEIEARELLLLSIRIALILSITVLISLLLFDNKIIAIFGLQDLGWWLYFVPLTVFMSGSYQSLSYWTVRQKKFKILSISRLVRTTAGSVLQTVLGLLSISGGLISGLIASQFMGFRYLKDEAFSVSKKRTTLGYVKTKELLNKYKSFPIFDMPAIFCNLLANQAPVLVLAKYFGAGVLGQYALTNKIINAPISLISGSLLDVFRQKVTSDINSDGNCRYIFLHTLKILSMLGLAPLILLIFYGPDIFKFIFGEKWHQAGDYARIMAPMFYLKFIAGPLSYVLIARQWQKVNLIGQMSLLLSTIAVLVYGILTLSVINTLYAYTAAYSFIYISYIAISYKASL